ncbi:MAG TPA: hypothetical protein VFW45_11980 [Candidatus Polarisedimenticolia bacterium]|nr:hypothetical protein [Candidatus Polarisedimenticolia bacterium]
MGDWLLNLPVLWMGVVILGITYLVTAGIYGLVTRLAVGERGRSFTAISSGILSPLAIVFALLVGFLAAQVWNEADRANTAVNREASALRAVILLAGEFPGEPEARLHDLIRGYIQEAATEEWPAMAGRHATLAIAPVPLAKALRLVLSLAPQREGQVLAQREMVASIESAFDARRQRIILSRSSVNWVKWTVLLVQAGLTLITVAMIHSNNRGASRIILAIFATGVGVAVLLIASHSRPFGGEISAKPAVLLQVMPEAAPPGSATR